MKKVMLWSAALTLISSQVQSQPQDLQAQNLISSQAALSHQMALNEEKPMIKTESQAPAVATVPVTPSTQANPTVASSAASMDCNYKIPADMKKVDDATITSWSEKAVMQSFSFAPEKVDAQVSELQPCFTDQGWTGFSAALKKSGNVEAIKAQKLSVSSQVMGQTQVSGLKEDQWKVAVPLQVTYQNDKDKATQLLNIELTVSRKPNDGLGIMQMIAAPKNTAVTIPAPAANSSPAPAAEPTTPAAAPNNAGSPAAPATPSTGK